MEHVSCTLDCPIVVLKFIHFFPNLVTILDTSLKWLTTEPLTLAAPLHATPTTTKLAYSPVTTRQETLKATKSTAVVYRRLVNIFLFSLNSSFNYNSLIYREQAAVQERIPTTLLSVM